MKYSHVPNAITPLPEGDGPLVAKMTLSRSAGRDRRHGFRWRLF